MTEQQTQIWRSFDRQALDDIDRTLRNLEGDCLRQKQSHEIASMVFGAFGMPLADAYKVQAGQLEGLARAIADQRVEVALVRRVAPERTEKGR